MFWSLLYQATITRDVTCWVRHAMILRIICIMRRDGTLDQGPVVEWQRRNVRRVGWLIKRLWCMWRRILIPIICGGNNRRCLSIGDTMSIISIHRGWWIVLLRNDSCFFRRPRKMAKHNPSFLENRLLAMVPWFPLTAFSFHLLWSAGCVDCDILVLVQQFLGRALRAS